MPTSLSLFDLKPGKILLDRYQILRPHREAGISAAFAVEDSEDESRKELLAFPAGLFEGHEQASEFGDRLSAWRGLDIEGITTLHEVRVLDDGAVLLVTDFPSGLSMRSWMNDNPRMEQGEVLALGGSLLKALAQVHETGQVHGDIKPAAIHFKPGEGRGELLDGGITPAMWAAKHLGTRTALIGTPYYAPLEQFTGDSPDELSDLYNLATVMYELLTGVLPWSGKGYIEVFQSKMQKHPPAMSQRAPGVEIVPDLEAVVARGLCAERKARHPSAEAFLGQLLSVDVARA
jgi:serine/threonine protein kinase